MKVVIIENVITPYEIIRFNVINRELNNNLTVLFQNESDLNRDWDLEKSRMKFNYKVLPDTPIRLKGKDLITLHLNFSTYSELKNINPDVIVCCGWDSLATYMAYVFSMIFKKKLVLWSGSTVNELSWRRTVSKPLVKFIVKHSDSYIAYGTRAKEYLTALGADARKIFIGWNTVDNALFEKGSAIANKEKEILRNKLGIKTKKVLLYVGQLIERKGIYNLLDAFSKLKKDTDDVTLLFVGTGMERENMGKRCADENIRDVVFSGFVEYEQLPKYYAISDVFILPSHEEVWGLVINEAMACGLPVITTDKVGASADLVKDGVNGFVVGDGDSEKLYNAMKNIVEDNRLRQEMGQASRKIINNFTVEHTARGIRDAIAFAVSG